MTTENKIHLTDRHGVEGLIAIAVERIAEATRIYRPVYMAGALSGGGDSIAACKVASLAPNFGSMFHCDTGVGLEATERYVEQVCKDQGWPLEVFKAAENCRHNGQADPQNYFQIVKENGFPGPAMHFKMYARLKQRQIEAWCRKHKKFRSREKVMLVSGRRMQESKRRERTTEGANNIDPSCKRLVWCNPLWDASKLDCQRIREFAGIEKSQVVHLIHMSGECLCGAFGHPNELAELKLWFPDDPTVKRLLSADAEEKAAGRWGWGAGGPPKQRNCPVKKSGAMCSSCDAKNAMPAVTS